MIGLDSGFLFVHIPKTGGNALQTALAPFASDAITPNKRQPRTGFVDRLSVRSQHGLRKHARLHEYRSALDPGDYAKLFKFATVRNPFDRLVSKMAGSYLRSMEKKGIPYEEVPPLPFNAEIMNRVIDVAPRVDEFVTLPEQSVVDLIRDTDIDVFIRFENLQQGFDAVCDRIGLPRQELPVLNVSVRRNYREYFDAQLRARVEEKFAPELECFGYEF